MLVVHGLQVVEETQMKVLSLLLGYVDGTKEHVGAPTLIGCISPTNTIEPNITVAIAGHPPLSGVKHN